MRASTSITALFAVGAMTWPSPAQAHLPNLASYRLEQVDGHWNLVASLPTDGMHHALEGQHPGEALSKLSPEAYEQLLDDALRAGIELRFDHEVVELGDAQVTLAAHESHVRYPLVGVRAAPATIDAHIDALSGGHHQNNVLMVVTPNASERVVLDDENDFRASIRLPSLRYATGLPAQWERAIAWAFLWAIVASPT